MDKWKLKSHMTAHHDRQAELAAALGVSRQTVNNKLNNWKGSQFNTQEIAIIIKRYNLMPKDLFEIFFADEMSS